MNRTGEENGQKEPSHTWAGIVILVVLLVGIAAVGVEYTGNNPYQVPGHIGSGAPHKGPLEPAEEYALRLTTAANSKVTFEKERLHFERKTEVLEDGGKITVVQEVWVNPAELDTFVFGRSTANTHRSKDIWEVGVFCLEEKLCIHHKMQRGDKLTQSRQSSGPLFTVTGETRAQATMDDLEGLIQVSGGESMLPREGSISHLLRQGRKERHE